MPVAAHGRLEPGGCRHRRAAVRAGADRRGGRRRRTGRPVRQAGRPSASSSLGQCPHVAKVVGRQHLCRCEHRCDRHPVALSRRHQCVHGLVGEQLGDQRADLTGRRESWAEAVVLRILELLWLAQPGAHAAPLPWRHHAGPHIAVFAGVDRVHVLVARAAAPDVGTPLRQRTLAHRAERRIQRLNNGIESGKVDVISCAVTKPMIVGAQARPMRLAQRRSPTRSRRAV